MLEESLRVPPFFAVRDGEPVEQFGVAGLLAADPEVWSNPQNGQAVVVYLLSGGTPQIVRKLPRDRLNVDERLFLYLPFEHSEQASDQARAVSLISGLGDAEYTRFALAHQHIITRFGRFPHRNAALARPSCDDELAFLKLPGSSF